MIMKNKKGFTLIEVIAVVVVVSILVLLIIPMISKYIKQGKDEYNKQLEAQLTLVGKDYYASNSIKLPKESNITQVWLPYLKTNNYTSEEFKDADGGACTKSYVRVKNNGGTYEYIPCLNCDNYKTNNSSYCVLDDSFINTDTGEEEIITLPPTCNIRFDSYSGGWATGAETVTITGNVDPLTNIVNYMIGSDVITPDASGIGKATINRSGKVTAIIQDSAGKTGECVTDKELKIDTTAPVCTWSSAYKDKDGNAFSDYPKRGEKVYYKLNCTDAESGIVTDPTASQIQRTNTNVFTGLSLVDTSNVTNGKVYTFAATAGDDGYGNLILPANVVKDGVGRGNSPAVSDKIYIYTPSSGTGGGTGGGSYTPPPEDNDGPSCTITMKKADGTSYYEGDWSNQNVTVTANCTDSSGIKSIDYSPSSTITSEGITNVDVTAIDNYGNISYYYKTVKIDKTKPRCTVTMRKYTGTASNPTYVSDYINGYWTQYAVRVDVACSDTGGSELATHSIRKSSSSESMKKYVAFTQSDGEGTLYAYINAEDNAGNAMSQITKTIKRDRTSPNIVFERSGNRVRAVCKAGDGNTNLSDITITKYSAKQYNGPVDNLKDYEGKKGISTTSVYVDLFENSDTYIVAGCIDAALNADWIQSKFTRASYDKTVSEQEYFWSSTNSGSGNCNAGINCCSSSSGRICNSSNHNKYRYKSCNSYQSIDSYSYSYSWEYYDSGGSQGTVKNSTADEWCKNHGYTAYYASCSRSCTSSSAGRTCRSASGAGGSKVYCTINKCTENKTPNYTTNYKFGVKNECLYRTNDTKTTKGVDSCTEGTTTKSNGSDGTLIQKTTCKLNGGTETKMDIEGNMGTDR